MNSRINNIRDFLISFFFYPSQIIRSILIGKIPEPMDNPIIFVFDPNLDGLESSVGDIVFGRIIQEIIVFG